MRRPVALAALLVLPFLAHHADATEPVKPPLGGLLTRGVPNSTEAPYLGGFAIVPSWRDLEPRRGTYDFSFIDQRLATARKYGLGVKFRVIAGTEAPDWAKSIGGAPMPAWDHQRKVQTNIGRFWTADYQSAWRELQSALAARYDSDPAVREVNISGTGVISAEVMLLMANDKSPVTGKTNGSYWLAAGYTESQRRAALVADIDFMASRWTHTRLDLGLHPIQSLDPTGRVSSSPTATLDIYDAARAAHPGLIAFNTGFGMPVINGQQAALRSIYDGVFARQAPMDLQTLNLGAGMGDETMVLNWAASHGILSLELPSGKEWLRWSSTLLNSTNAKLKANAAAVAAPPSKGDTTAPELQVTSPAADSTVASGPVNISGTATDDNQVARVVVGIRNSSDQWLQDDGSWGVGETRTLRPAELTTVGAKSTSWTASWTPTEPGRYAAVAVVGDGSGNRTSSGRIHFTVG